jgi:hypothetical protein
MTAQDDPLDDAEALMVAAELGVAQRRVVLSLSEGWASVDDHRTAKRMLAIRDAKGVIERRAKSENMWRLTPIGSRVRAVLMTAVD